MEIPITIIIGSPRSGTSILGQVLDQHPRISTWLEPYYIWDHHFREAPNDQREARDATEKVRTWIRGAFSRYWRAMGADLVVDKSPRNCLRIPFVQSVFPEARYILLLRDGRDTALSIKRQWEGKKGIVVRTDREDQWGQRVRLLRRWMGRQPLWRYRFRALYFEAGPPNYWFKRKFLHKIRWEGRFGWGPRFEGWQGIIDQVSPLEFAAHQWAHSVRGVIQNLPAIPEERRLLMKYEAFIEEPRTWLERIFSFLGVEFPEGFMERIPQIHSGNANKWVRAFSREDLRRLGPIVGKVLLEAGYETDESWYQDPEA